MTQRKSVQELIDIFKAARNDPDHGIKQRQKFLQSYPDIDQQDEDGFTALVHAVRLNSPLLCSDLVEAGANVNLRDDDGNVPVYYATVFKHWDVVRQLVKSGADINMYNQFGQTPLHVAIESQDEKMLEVVLSMEGVDTNICTQHGDPPLVLALSLKYLKCKSGILNSLLDAGADVNSTNPVNGITPLMRACLPPTGGSQNIRLLIGAGANLKQRDTSGQTAIHYCRLHSSMDVVKVLLKAGASTNAIDNEGNTPLASLTSSSSDLISIPNIGNARQLLPLLLEYGANPNLLTSKINPDMLMSLTTELGNSAVLELLAAGCEPSSVIKDQHTEQPLCIAIKRKYFDIANLLMDGLFYKNIAYVLKQYTKQEMAPEIAALLKELQEAPSLQQQCRRVIHRAILPTTPHRRKHVENFPIGQKLQRYILYKY